MLGPHWFLRMKRWVQHPPSGRRVALVLGVLAACLLIVTLERLGYWPEWMTAERVGRLPGRGGF